MSASTALPRRGVPRPRGRVRERMRERGIDVLLVISPPNLCYLTGFESVWYPPRAPVGVVVCADDERLVFLDYERHETLVRDTAHLDDAVFYRYRDVLETIAATFRDRGWLAGTIGVERWSQSPGAPLVAALAARLGAGRAGRRRRLDRRSRPAGEVARRGRLRAPGCGDRRRRVRRPGRARPARPDRAADRGAA